MDETSRKHRTVYIPGTACRCWTLTDDQGVQGRLARTAHCAVYQMLDNLFPFLHRIASQACHQRQNSRLVHLQCLRSGGGQGSTLSSHAVGDLCAHSTHASPHAPGRPHPLDILAPKEWDAPLEGLLRAAVCSSWSTAREAGGTPGAPCQACQQAALITVLIAQNVIDMFDD